MTLYWWMHWFWITCRLIFFILSASSKPVTTSIGNLETFVVQNRPLRRNIKSVSQSLHVQSQIPVLPVTFPTNSVITDTAINEILPQLYDTNSNISVDRCTYYPTNSMNNSNSTFGPKNETQFFCNHSTPDNLLLTKDDSSLKISINLSNTLIIGDDVTENNILDISNISTYSLPTKEYIDNHNGNISPTVLSSVSITGIIFGVVMLIGIICATSFVLYRRGIANQPQTLNDKCSNLNSSGYIDDSSMRENSEEMCSLDNDSFLNSLEVMTIQNYWTDKLKHTKL